MHQLLKDNIHTFNYRVNGGTYNIGIPISPANETVYGTNRGLRIVPLLLFLTSMQKLFGVAWDRIYFLFILIIPYLIFDLSVKYFYKKAPVLITLTSASFYAFNPWVFSRLETGFWQLHIAYAMLPWVIFSSLNINKVRGKKETTIYIILMAIALSLIYQSQPHFLLMLFIPIMAIFITSIKKLDIKIFLIKIVSIGVIFILLNSYQIVTSILFTPFRITRENTYFSLDALNYNGQGSQILDIFKLTPRSPLNMQIKNDILSIFNFSYLLFTTVVLFLYKKQKKFSLIILILSISLILSIYFGKGTNIPFNQASIYLYKTFKILHYFRDPSRFYSMIVLFSSIIIFYSYRLKINKNIYKIFMILLLISVVNSTIQLSKEIGYQELPYNKYNSVSNEGRVLIVPNNVLPHVFSWYQNTASGGNNSPLEALYPISNNLANFSGSSDTLFSQLTNFALKRLLQKKEFSKLLDRLLINNIIVDTNIDQSLLGYDINQVLSSLLKNDFSIIKQVDGIYYFQKAYTNYYVLDSKPIFLVGDLNFYEQVSKNLDSNIPIIILNELSNAKMFVESDIKNERIIIKDDDAIQSLIFTSLREYTLDMDKTVINRNLAWISHEPYIDQELSQGMMMTSGKSIASTSVNSQLSHTKHIKSGLYTLAIEMTNGISYGSLDIVVNKKKYSCNNFKLENPLLRWCYFENIQLNDNLNLDIVSTNTNISIINDLLLIPKDDHYKAIKSLRSKIADNNPISISELDSSLTKPVKIYSNSDYGVLKINSDSNWITFRFPFDTYWTRNDEETKFISDYYGMTFYGARPTKKIWYVPEVIFIKLALLSLISFGAIIAAVACLSFFFKNKKN